MDWNRYGRIVGEYDAMLEYATTTSSKLIGLVPSEVSHGYAEQIFVKLLAHATTLRQLAPDPERRKPKELWDLSSACTIARAVIEAYDAMAYIVLGTDDQVERTYRILLWELHDYDRRVKMLESIGSTSPDYIKTVSDAEGVRKKIKISAHHSNVSPGIKKKMDERDAPAFLLGRKERCIAANINFDYYNTVTMHLSQYVHTLPFAVHQLFSFKAGGSSELHLMSLPLQYTLTFLAQAIQCIRKIFGAVVPEPSPDMANTLIVRAGIVERGMRNTG